MPDEPLIDVNDPDYDDPIVAEVHEIRRQMMAEFNHDIKAFDAYIKRCEQEHPERMSKRRPRPIRRAR